MRVLSTWILLAIGISATLLACQKAPGPVMSTALRAGMPTRAAAADPGTAVLLAAGDVAFDTPGAEITAKLLDTLPGTIVGLGDLAYNDGGAADFARFYAPTWGRHKARTRPVVGNHEYHTAGASGYFDYFGDLAGSRSQGYYAVDPSPTWHMVVLNSNEAESGGLGPGSPQYAWLERDLAAHATQNVVACWHHPRYSSGHHGDNKNMQAIWALLVSRGVDIVVAGHDHDYERFVPMDATGNPDNAKGIRSWVVGTGGRSHYPFLSLAKKTTAVRNAMTFGVLKLSLRAHDYDWKFIPEPGKTFTDAGTSAVNQ